MLDRDGYPAGVPCWVDTTQPDPDAAVAFYATLFGWDLEDRMPADGPGHYYVAQLHGRDVAAIGSQPDPTATSAVWNTYIWVEDVDASATAVQAAGGAVLAAPFDVLDAGRMAVCADPAGAAFCLWEARGHRGAQLVNEPGTWNFSDLNTRDPEGAEHFYGDVFGWEVNAFEAEGQSFPMFCREGYGDFLEQRDPELRHRQAEQEAPAGFEDVIAGFVTMTSDQFPDDVPSHWHVTFAVDDPDAIAEKATDLGGTVVAPPFDAGPVRMAVLVDPQGAVFTVGKYQPEV